jgi:hypothetical protein
MKNPLKGVSFEQIFKSGNIPINPIFPYEPFVLRCHGTSGSFYNQSIELNTSLPSLSLPQKMHIQQHIGRFEVSSRNHGRLGDTLIIKYNTKNTKL